jgi:hypothetical protein
MKIPSLFLAALLLMSKMSVGQNQPSVEAGLDLGGGFNSTGWSPSFLYHEEANFGEAQWFKLGVGIRFWGFYAKQSDLQSQDEVAVPDVLKYQNLSANGLSFVVGAAIRVGRVDLGANTDLVGLVYGSSRHALYPKPAASPTGDGVDFYNKRVATVPVIANALPLLLKRQTGQSELYARIAITRGLGIKLGYMFGRIAYVTKKVEGKPVILDNGQQRFSKTYGMPYAALAINLSQ